MSSYPSSEKIEEVAFLSAKSIYHLSPVYTKQQTETIDALEKLQVFINRFPESEYLEEANTLIKELDFKLEQKAYSIAKQYNLISDYQASIKSFDNFLLDYPGSRLREEALYYRFDAAYKLAINSVEFRQEERINKALGYFQSLKSAYPESGFMEAAEISKAEMEQLLQQPDTKS